MNVHVSAITARAAVWATVCPGGVDGEYARGSRTSTSNCSVIATAAIATVACE
ncbi:MAG: hypothetical protein V3V39_11980 [Desulfobacterales bacterium]